MLNQPTAHELVARGAQLLDEKLPGWADQIDLDSLAMESECRCVLGQLAGVQVNLDALGIHGSPRYSDGDGYRFEDAVVGLGISADDHGFATVDWDPKTEQVRERYYVTFDDLQDAWKGEIVARRTL